MDSYMHTFTLSELNQLPELFQQPEELYIMLLDYIYTDRYNCIQQYDAIIQYCTENSYLVDPQAQLSNLNNTISPMQFVHAVLLICVSLISSKKYELANKFAIALKNDVTTQIQDYHLQDLMKQQYNVSLNVSKLFNKKLQNLQFYVNTATMICSISFEGINDYETASKVLEQLQEKDVAFSLSYLRLKFNAAFSFNNQYYSPMMDTATYSLSQLNSYCESILQKKFQQNFFNYDQRLINYICKLYQARINSLLNKNEMANQQFVELWQLAPDEESYEESIAIYLDNFVRYALPTQKEVLLITQSPLMLYMLQSRQNIVDQAIQTALELSQQQQHPGVQAVSYYYLGVFYVLKKDLKKALEYFKLAKKTNSQIYKYPSEMVILTWLPQMLDFDIISLMILTADPDLQFCNQKDYFEKLISRNSILLKLSPERSQLCMPLQVLMELQCYIHEQAQDTEPLLSSLARTGLIDEKFGSNMNMRYIEHTEANSYVIAQVFVLALQIFDKNDPEVSINLNQHLNWLIDEFKPSLNFIIDKKLFVQKEEVQKLFNPLEIKSTKKSSLIQSLNKYIMKVTPPTDDSRNLQVMAKTLQSSMESAFGLVGLLKEGTVLRLFQLYRRQNYEEIEQNYKKEKYAIQIYALCLIRQNKVQEAVQFLNENIEATDDKQQKALLFHLLGKIYADQQNFEGAQGIMQQIYNVFPEDSINKQSLIFDLAQVYLRQNNLNSCLEILEGLNTNYAKLLKASIVLQQFQFQISSPQMIQMLQSVLGDISDLDKKLLTAACDIQKRTLDDEFNQELSDVLQFLIQQLDQIQQLYQKPKSSAIMFNQFFFRVLSTTDLQPCQDAELNTKSLFYSDYFDQRVFCYYYISLIVSLSLILNLSDSVQFQIVENYLMFQSTELDASYIQNLLVFAVKQNRPEFVEQILRFASKNVQELFMSQVQQEEINVTAQSPVQLLELQFLQKTYKFAVVNPKLPVNLPEFINDQTFNPLNQILFQEYLNLGSGSTQEEIEVKRGLNDVFTSEFGMVNVETKQIDQFEIQQEIYNKKKEEETKAKGIKRAPSARPLLRQNKAEMQGKQLKPPRPLRKFKE
ncbi:Conserved_hypothetical protein [Hexamita inflata]|uniref:Tetratricopeptide repeat protein n=1 Tax=Hexamita inflata TaxID=28002 RepID=A0AA86Q9N6_9EUKA|nr:Conserved hypothetical protein [Hexamita inflata]CAI9948859.1 Conserved hypothetical protein [Hexamita inflata]